MLTFGLTAVVSAGGNPPPALSSGFQLQNRSTSNAASVSMDYYDTTGTLKTSVTDSIPAKASKSYYVPNVTGLPDGRYSVVVSSSEALFSLVNEVTASGASPNVEATHNGFTGSDTGSPLYLPWVVCNYYNYNSMFAVQNAGTAAVEIDVDFVQSGQSAVTKHYAFAGVLPGMSVYLDLTKDPYKTDLQGITGSTTGFYGAVKAYSASDAQPLAAVLNDTDPNGAMLRSYNAVKAGSTDLVAAQVASKYYGYSSGITLQNPDASNDANATITFYASGSTTPAATWTGVVSKSSAKAIYLPNVSGMPLNFNGTAVVHADRALMGISTQVTEPPGPAVAFNLTPVSDAQTTLYAPQIVRAYYGFESGYQLWNIGPEQVSVAATFTNPDGSTKATINHTIPAGTSLAYYLGDARGASLGTNFNGGAIFTVTSGNGKLIGIGNFVSPNGGDNKRSYNLFY